MKPKLSQKQRWRLESRKKAARPPEKPQACSEKRVSRRQGAEQESIPVSRISHAVAYAFVSALKRLRITEAHKPPIARSAEMRKTSIRKICRKAAEEEEPQPKYAQLTTREKDARTKF
eukprot:287987-Rhodomonas_salina.1